ncbi:Hsp20/alpha crystallin family protein [Syntrophorhabdus aromaticivorans]|jgi:HSP20 family molecular chaperone IbpA|uniref:Hsp20/alpha crystallin family protein n=1 Tax=Syntrophorhabdus aromaticivorans TaxID=328301 RepID=UPI0004162C43|nr:Hsp20/alpha crystallin family protein [Syntrophorhabdus aromaticivorans]OPY61633.1 MAG: Spore protein SP21 [Syntrophorhabdaceae bacterium PtaU1.Bin034]
MAETGTQVQKKEAQVPERMERTRANRVYTPQVDIIEGPDNIVVTADMPGVDDKSVDISLEKNILSIYGRVEDMSFDNHRPLFTEYGTGDYERSFTLSDEIDRERIQASVKNGVLKVVLPKVAAAKSRKIAVTAEV